MGFISRIELAFGSCYCGNKSSCRLFQGVGLIQYDDSFVLLYMSVFQFFMVDFLKTWLTNERTIS